MKLRTVSFIKSKKDKVAEDLHFKIVFFLCHLENVKDVRKEILR